MTDEERDVDCDRWYLRTGEIPLNTDYPRDMRGYGRGNAIRKANLGRGGARTCGAVRRQLRGRRAENCVLHGDSAFGGVSVGYRRCRLAHRGTAAHEHGVACTSMVRASWFLAAASPVHRPRQRAGYGFLGWRWRSSATRKRSRPCGTQDWEIATSWLPVDRLPACRRRDTERQQHFAQGN